MKPAFTPLTIVAILAAIGLAFWLRSQVGADRAFVHDPVVRVASPGTPGVPDRSQSGVIATPDGKRLMTPAERTEHREELRTQLVALLNEAETLVKAGEEMVAAGKPNSSIPRVNEIIIALKPIAADTVFPDVQTAASNGVEALKVSQSAPITKAAGDARALPPP